MYFPIISVVATFLKDSGFWREDDKGDVDFLVKEAKSHSRISVSFTEQRTSVSVMLQGKNI